MKIFTDFKVSKPTKNNWSGVFGYRPEKGSLANVYGEMFAVMSISSEVDFELSHIGDMLFDEMQASYFEEYKTQLEFEDFEQAMAKVHERITAVLDREPELSEKGIDLEMAVMVIKGDAMYGGVVGESKVYIARGENFAEIGKSFIDANNDGFMRSGSIELEPEDRLLLATSKLAEKQDSDIPGMLANFQLQSVTGVLGAMLAVGYELAADPKQAEIVVEEPETVEVKIPEAKIEDNESLGNKDLPTTQSQEIIPMSEPEFSEESDSFFETDEASSGQIAEAEGGAESEEEQINRVAMLKGRAVVAFTGIQNRLVLAKNAATNKVAELRARRSLSRSEIDHHLEEEDNEAALSNEFVQSDAEPSRTGKERIDNMRERARSLFNGVTNTGSGFVAAVRSRVLPAPGDRTMYLRKGRSQTQWKTMILVGVIVFVVLVLIINKRNEEVAVERHIQEIKTQISELENTWQQLKTEASAASIGEVPTANKQDIAVRISTLAKSANDLMAENIETDRLQAIITESQRSSDALFNVRSFTDPQLVSDLELTFEGADAASAVYSGGNIYVADKGRGVIYRMGTTLNSEVSSFASGLTSPYLLTADANGNIVFVDNNPDSVMGTVDAASGSVSRSPSVSLARVGTLSGMDVYDANGALYSVNPTKNIVVKQENISGNYVVPNEAAPWRQDADFANAVALKVDYSIFLLVRGKGLQRYEGGEPATYNPNGFAPSDVEALKNASAFELTATKLYIADPVNRRLIVADRTNADNYTFKEQYVYRGSDETVFSKMQSVTVNESSGKIYVLDGSRVIRLDI